MSLEADLLLRPLIVAFCIGSAYALTIRSVSSESFLPANTVTLYAASPSGTSNTTTDVQASMSIGLSPLGTLSDGSTTTYLEENVEFHTTILSGDITTLVPATTATAILIEGALGYDLIESSSDSWRDVRCTFDGSGSSRSASCVESAGSVSLNVISSTPTQTQIALSTTSYLEPAVPFFTLTVSTPAPSATSTTTSATPTSNSTLRKHSHRNLVGRAVGGAIGGALFISILAFLLFLLLRRNRRRKRSPSQQYMRSISPAHAASHSQTMMDLPRDVKDVSSSLRPWTIESGSTSTFKDKNESVAPIAAISSPFIPPSSRTETPESPPPPLPPPPPTQGLPSDRASKFIEQLMVNSTDLDVLMAIAKAEAEAARKKGGIHDEQPFKQSSNVDDPRSEFEPEPQPQLQPDRTLPDSPPPRRSPPASHPSLPP